MSSCLTDRLESLHHAFLSSSFAIDSARSMILNITGKRLMCINEGLQLRVAPQAVCCWSKVKLPLTWGSRSQRGEEQERSAGAFSLPSFCRWRSEALGGAIASHSSSERVAKGLGVTGQVGPAGLGHQWPTALAEAAVGWALPALPPSTDSTDLQCCCVPGIKKAHEKPKGEICCIRGENSQSLWLPITHHRYWDHKTTQRWAVF